MNKLYSPQSIKQLLDHTENYQTANLNILQIRKHICQELLMSDGCLNKLIVKKCEEFGITNSDIHLQLNQLIRLNNSFSPIAAALYNLRNIISHTKPLTADYVVNLIRVLAKYVNHHGIEVETYNSLIFTKKLLSNRSIASRN